MRRLSSQLCGINPEPVQCATDCGENEIDFFVCCREWWRDGDEIADAADDHAFLADELRAFDAEHRGGSESRFSTAREKLDRSDELATADFTDGGMPLD